MRLARRPLANWRAAETLRTLLAEARSGTRTLIMGVLNVTPDSFSDGGLYLDPDRAIAHAREMIAEGADIIDVGGESTRPATFTRHAPLDSQEEMRRVLPIIAALNSACPEILISIDTYKAEVAAAAVAAGAAMVNDVSALRADTQMAGFVAESEVPVVLMHMPGLPTQLDPNTTYQDVVREVRLYLEERIEVALRAGVAADRIVIDPGIGFGKGPADNLELLRRLGELRIGEYPLLVGTSRKSTIGHVLGDAPPDDRLEGTAATVAIAIANGASIVRVHDVRPMSRVVRMADAIVRGWPRATADDQPAPRGSK